MPSVHSDELPQNSLLIKYQQQGAFTDCYYLDLPRTVTQTDYIEAFYTTRLFKVERALLSSLAAKPSSDLQAAQLAKGETIEFAAWRVEDRTPNQLLLREFTGRTRSWLMTDAAAEVGSGTTRLYFGSAVVPVETSGSGQGSFGFLFHALSGFHKLYSRALLSAAASALTRSKQG